MVTGVYIHGIRGRMGRAVAALVQADPMATLQDKIETADVVIDFSSPVATIPLLEKCRQYQKPVVIGTTGHTSENEQALREAAERIAILFSPNFSIGMAACLQAAQLIATDLKGLCSIDIVEAHHRHKKDNPSGTAAALAKAMNGQSIPIHSIRAGDIVGDHTVFFTLNGERIELKHQVHSREPFAQVAVQAAKFLIGKPPKLYSIQDIFL